MKAYVSAPAGLSRAMSRVSRALTQHAPITIVQDEHEADLVILHVIGYPETVAAIESLKARGKKYAMIQYCLRSTQAPNTGAWLPLWADEDCLCVWSYYDLIALVREDFGTGDTGHANVACFLEKFYHAPMGVNSKLFRAQPGRAKRYEVMTSGYTPTTNDTPPGGEAIRECAAAVEGLGDGQRMFHLGPGFEFFGPHVTQEENIGDEYLVDILNSSKYVAGLRWMEGFEMPALEGLLCGARPVCFDRPHYRYWFGEHAVYVPEGSPEQVEKDLEAVFRGNYRQVTVDERMAIASRFDWSVVASGFWAMALPPVVTSAPARKKRLLWVGDAVVSSGFARSTHKVLEGLTEEYDVAVLAINFFGDPHTYPYPIYPCLNPFDMECDMIGVRRITEIAVLHQADLIVLQQDPWLVKPYITALRKAGINTPVIGFIAVDGKNCKGAELNDLALAIFWTQFGMDEARKGGYTGPAAVVPLGVDTSIYYPMPKREARVIMELPVQHQDTFIVGNVNRNQPRKRLDLTVRYFCEWVKQYDVRDARLFLHVAPTGDVGWEVKQLMHFYGGKGRLLLATPDVGRGVTEDLLRATYCSLDVQVNTGAGEGWGLTTLEGMACGVPQEVGDWAALGEWPEDAVVKVPCTSFTHTVGGPNVVGGVPDEAQFIKELHRLYSDRRHYDMMCNRAHARAQHPMFRWENIGRLFAKTLTQLREQEMASA